ncbi:MAG: hypothetical protein ACRDP7_24970 [Trebonia sp.]
MRTEDDLRAALSALERHAPAAARVLPGSQRHSHHGLRSPRTVRWLAVTITAAALAAAVTALTLPTAPTRSIPNGSVASPSGQANSATLRAKLLAAFSAASDDIVYVSSTSLNTGESPIVTESWSYPSQPSPGRLVRSRNLTYNLSGTLRYDDERTFVMPPPGTSSVPGHITTMGERILVDYVGKTWSDQKGTSLFQDNPNGSALITYDIKTAHWTVRRTTLNGRAALELSWKAAQKGNSSTTYLWVDAATYLPLRETDAFGPSGMITSATFNYEYLPATPVNLAKLTPPIPAGFKRVNGVTMTGPNQGVVAQPFTSR